MWYFSVAIMFALIFSAVNSSWIRQEGGEENFRYSILLRIFRWYSLRKCNYCNEWRKSRFFLLFFLHVLLVTIPPGWLYSFPLCPSPSTPSPPPHQSTHDGVPLYTHYHSSSWENNKAASVTENDKILFIYIMDVMLAYYREISLGSFKLVYLSFLTIKRELSKMNDCSLLMM